MAALSNRLGTAQAIDKFQADTEEAESVQKLQEFVYEEVDEEPELHLRTYVALAAMFLLNLSQLIALQGPPSMVSRGQQNLVRRKWYWLITRFR